MTTEALRAALSLLVDVLSDRHYGRMPERVQIAYDAARAALAQTSTEPVAWLLYWYCCRIRACERLWG